MRKAIFLSLLLLLPYAAFGQAATKSSIGVLEGTDKQMETEAEGTPPVHREVVVLTYTRAHTEAIKVITVTTAAQSVFDTLTGVDCVSVLLKADINNNEAVWVDPTGGTPAVGQSFPLYPGDVQSFRAPNAGDCSAMKAIASASCTSCKLYAVAQ